MNDDIEVYKKRLALEKSARLQAEKIAEENSRELYLKQVELEKSFAALESTKLEIETLLKALKDFTNTLDPSTIVDHLRGFIEGEMSEFIATISVVAREESAGINYRMNPEGCRSIETDCKIFFRLTRLHVAELAGSSCILNEVDDAILKELKSPAPTLLVPLISHGIAIGFLAIHGMQENCDATNIRFFQALANEVAVSLQNALLYREIDRLSRIDPLTGLMNRRSFTVSAIRFLQLAIRYNKPLSAAMLDIDFFKKVNDTYGHAMGDDVLKSVAKTCEGLIRRSDIVGRFGGEEFCFLFPETAVESASLLAERIRVAISSLTFESEGQNFQVTASIGLAELHGEADSLETMLSRSDEALYQAKESGRDRVVVWNEKTK